MNRHLGRSLIVAALVACPCGLGCKRQEAPPHPIPEVAVVTVEPQHVVLTSELPGRTSAYLISEIRPQVNGLIQKRLFTEGSLVKADQILYQIDPAPYQAALDSAAANLLSARKGADRARASLGASVATVKRHQATLSLAKLNLARYEDLLKNRAVSAMDRDQYATDVDVAEATLGSAEAQVESDKQAVAAAEAAIKQAEAALETVRINLGYCKITAPISGRIGRSNVTEGATVTAYQATALATIQQLDPIYVDVPQSTAEVNRLRRSLASGRLKENGTDKVKLLLEDGTAYPLVGSLKFRDVTVDPTTGSIILRIVVPNPDNTLLPNMFVRTVIDEGVNDRAILVPQQAVSRDPKGNPYVLIVQTAKSEDEKQEAREVVKLQPITTDRAFGDKWLASSGLEPGDRVVVEGSQRARPGSPVKAVPFQPGGTPEEKPAGTAKATGQPNRK